MLIWHEARSTYLYEPSRINTRTFYSAQYIYIFMFFLLLFFDFSIICTITCDGSNRAHPVISDLFGFIYPCKITCCITFEKVFSVVFALTFSSRHVYTRVFINELPSPLNCQLFFVLFIFLYCNFLLVLFLHRRWIFYYYYYYYSSYILVLMSLFETANRVQILTFRAVNWPVIIVLIYIEFKDNKTNRQITSF